ncbi:MAG: PAS domain-containing protein, partial [bacterium]
MSHKDSSDRAPASLMRAVEILFDRIPDIVFFVKDVEGRYVAVNRTLVDRCGAVGKEDLIGGTVLDIFPPPMGESYHRQDMAVLERGVPLTD